LEKDLSLAILKTGHAMQCHYYTSTVAAQEKMTLTIQPCLFMWDANICTCTTLN